MAAKDFHGDKNEHKKVVASLKNFRAQNKMKKVGPGVAVIIVTMLLLGCSHCHSSTAR